MVHGVWSYAFLPGQLLALFRLCRNRRETDRQAWCLVTGGVVVVVVTSGREVTSGLGSTNEVRRCGSRDGDRSNKWLA